MACLQRSHFWLVVVVAMAVSKVESAKTHRLLQSEPKVNLTVTSIKTCPNVETLVSDLNYELFNGTGRMNATLTKTVKSISKIVATISRCKTHCEHFQTWRFSSGCSIVEQKNTFWTPFLENFEPPVKCPCKEGFYKTNKAAMDTGLLLALPFPRENSKWRIHLEGFENEHLIVCLDVTTLFEVKNKIRRP